MIRKQIAAANWKMNLTLTEAENLINEISASDYKAAINQSVVFAVPFPYLNAIQSKINHPHFHICAQNMAATKNGAYTGEVSAEMLKSIGIHYVLIGHSERREYFHETNEILKKKVDLALEYDITPIFCCGEPLSIREEGTQNEYVAHQLKESLFHLDAEKMKHFIIAYEPIWAIGTGKTATSEQAQEMHLHIRSIVGSVYGNEIAATVSILYGGSVKAANASEIFGKEDVDGGLVGGASLVATEFTSIMKSLKNISL
jgi:triosephosphate isomerase